MNDIDTAITITAPYSEVPTKAVVDGMVRAADKPKPVASVRSDIDTAAIRARADKATAGPWRTLESTLGRHAQHDVYDCAGDYSYYKRGIARMNHGRTSDEANADFIAHARTDVPLLLDAVDALREQVVEATRVADDWTEIGRKVLAERDEATADLAAANRRVGFLESAIVQACNTGDIGLTLEILTAAIDFPNGTPDDAAEAQP